MTKPKPAYVHIQSRHHPVARVAVAVNEFLHDVDIDTPPAEFIEGWWEFDEGDRAEMLADMRQVIDYLTACVTACSETH